MIKKLFGVYASILRNTWLKLVNFNKLQSDDKCDVVIQTLSVILMFFSMVAFWTVVYFTVTNGIDWINVVYGIVAYVTCQVATWMSVRLSNETVWFRQ